MSAANNVQLASQRISDVVTGFPPNLYYFQGGRTIVSTASLAPNEQGAIDQAFDAGLDIIQKVSPKLAAEFAYQRPVAWLMGSLAKGLLTSTGAPKTITYPSMVGTVGVNWLFPQAVRYTSSATTSNPAYTDYNTDSWNIPLTANNTCNLFGSATVASTNIPGTQTSTWTVNNRYQAANQSNAHQFSFVFQNGVVEIGSTPSIEQWHIETSMASQYGVYTTNPINVQTVEVNKTIYQYQTLGVVPIYFDLGLNWAGLAQTTQTSQIMLMGMTFYEHGLFPNLQVV